MVMGISFVFFAALAWYLSVRSESSGGHGR